MDFQGVASTVHPPDMPFGFELCGRAAIRAGPWKADFIPFPKGISDWQLYNLETDPGEINDLAQSHPEKLKELLELWEKYVEEVGVVPLQPEMGRRWHEAMEEQMMENEWMEYEYWKPGGREEGRREDFVRRVKKFEDPRGKESSGPVVLENGESACWRMRLSWNT